MFGGLAFFSHFLHRIGAICIGLLKFFSELCDPFIDVDEMQLCHVKICGGVYVQRKDAFRYDGAC